MLLIDIHMYPAETVLAWLFLPYVIYIYIHTVPYIHTYINQIQTIHKPCVYIHVYVLTYVSQVYWEQPADENRGRVSRRQTCRRTEADRGFSGRRQRAVRSQFEVRSYKRSTVDVVRWRNEGMRIGIRGLRYLSAAEVYLGHEAFWSLLEWIKLSSLERVTFRISDAIASAYGKLVLRQCAIVLNAVGIMHLD